MVGISAHRMNVGSPTRSVREALLRAGEMGFDYIECDVRVSRDGELVIWHDDHLPGGRPLAAATVAEYRRAVAPHDATLSELLHGARGRIRLHLDLKDQGCEEQLLREVRATLDPAAFVITSLEDDSLIRLRRLEPGLALGLSLGREIRHGRVPTWWFRWLQVRASEVFPGRRLARVRPTFVAVHQQLARRALLRYCARHNLPAWVWTVDEPADIAHFLDDERVSVLITNRPDVALALRSDATVSHHAA